MSKKALTITAVGVGGIAVAGVATYFYLKNKSTTTPPPPPQTVTVTVTTSPTGGEVIVDSQQVPDGTTLSLAVGTHTISASPTNFQKWTTNGGVSVANPTSPSTTMTVNSAGDLNADFSSSSPPPPASGVSVTVHVQNNISGEGIPDSTTTLSGLSPQITDQSGNAVFNAVQAGTYTVTATATSYTTASTTVVVDGSDVSVIIDLAVGQPTQPPSCIEGTIQYKTYCPDGNIESQQICQGGQWVTQTFTCPPSSGGGPGTTPPAVPCTDSSQCPSGQECYNGQCIPIGLTAIDIEHTPIVLLNVAQVNDITWVVHSTSGCQINYIAGTDAYGHNVYSTEPGDWKVIVIDFNGIMQRAQQQNELGMTLGQWVCKYGQQVNGSLITILTTGTPGTVFG